MKISRYLIFGGGMVAGYAAKELVERGLKPGELTIVSGDISLPYERPPLSKGFLAGKDTEAGIRTISIANMRSKRDSAAKLTASTSAENFSICDPARTSDSRSSSSRLALA
jgi:hypothetical protein